MKNILSIFLVTACLAVFNTANAQQDGIKQEGNGWVWKTDSTLIMTKDFTGEIGLDIIYDFKDLKRLVIEEGVTSTENWQLGAIFFNNKFQSVTFPESLTEVSGLTYVNGGVRERVRADTIYAPWENPVAIENEIFWRPRMSLLIVPEGRVDAYKASDWSRNFARIGDAKGKYYWPDYWRGDWALSEDGRLFVSKDFEWSNDCEFWLYEPIRQVELEEGVKETGGNAFYGCGWNVTSVTLPKSLETIGDYAFQQLGCGVEGKAVEINLPNGLKRIGICAFLYANISSITLPLGLEHLGNYAFDGSKISSLKIQEGEEYLVGTGAFMECKSLRSVELPETLKEIGSCVFKECDSLCCETGLLVLPQNVRKIGDGAFQFCKSLRHIVLPASVDTVGTYAFSYISQTVDNTTGQSIRLSDLRIDCYAPEPPAIGDYYNGYFHKGRAAGNTYKDNLYVPAESVEKYKASMWAEEFNIYALDPEDNPYTAIRDVEDGKLKVDVRGGVVSVEGVDEFDVYDMSGRKMPAGRPLPAGVYVVTTGTRAERVVVK